VGAYRVAITVREPSPSTDPPRQVHPFRHSGGLKTLIGRLNQVCFIIPDALHFMNNIRSAMYRAVSSNSYVYLDKETKEDLRLWLEFVQAKEGISINKIVFRKPPLQNFPDASE